MEALCEMMGDLPDQLDHFSSDDGTISVTDKRIPNNDEVEDDDLFTGFIDGITGELRQGKRLYAKSGEVYEGSFAYDGKRHGDNAIVQHFQLPPPLESSLQATAISSDNLMGFLGKRFLYHTETTTSHDSSSSSIANTENTNTFNGTYQEDEPTYGNLVTDSYIYRGSFWGKRFHGSQGELIHNQFRYKGEFEHGFFHGVGKEICQNGTEYQGEYVQSMKHGMGLWKGPIVQEDDDEERKQKTQESDQADANAESETDNPNLRLQFCQNDVDEDDQTISTAQITTTLNRYVYSGMFHCNQRQGEGTEWTTTGEVYDGEFLANRRHGAGCLRKEGIRYEGEWRAGDAVIDKGGWRIIYNCETTDDNTSSSNNNSHSIYCGHVDSDLQPHGYGTLRKSDHTTYSGDWVHGRKEGQGIQSTPNGVEFTGDWRNNEPVQVKRVDETDGTLREITDFLLQSSTSSLTATEEEKKPRKKESEGNPQDDLGNSASPTEAPDDTDDDDDSSPRHKKQLLVLMQAMAQSKESSLNLLQKSTSLNDITLDYFTQESEYFLNKKQGSSSSSIEDSNDDSNSSFSSLPRSHLRHRRRSSKLSTYSNLPIDAEEDQEDSIIQKPKVHTYTNGDTYYGGFDPETRKRHGHGVFVSKATGWSYSGMFVQDQREGQGILMHATLGKYEGDFHNNVPHGRGTLIFNDSSSYHGPFKHGAFHGATGTFCHFDGTIYVGAWKHGVKDGEGMEASGEDGTVYRGRFVSGSKHGHGRLLDAHGKVIYLGEWRDDLYHGHGILRIKAAEEVVAKWEGDFVAGQRHGYGVLTATNPDSVVTFERNDSAYTHTKPQSWKGMWSHDVPKNGKWRIQYSNGTIYSGQATVLNHKDQAVLLEVTPDGFGTMQSHKGELQVGTFQGMEMLQGDFWKASDRILHMTNTANDQYNSL